MSFCLNPTSSGAVLRGDYAPYREHKVIELKAECTWQTFRNMPLFDFQLTRTGELASGDDMGFYLLKKVAP